jgi:hypothetical protein
MRGVTYEKERNRYRCYHTTLKGKVLQPKFELEYNAVWEKVNLCADDGCFPFTKRKRERGDASLLPIGLTITLARKGHKSAVEANLPTGDSTAKASFAYGHIRTLEQAVIDATWMRYDHCWTRLMEELKPFGPMKQSVLDKLAASTRAETESQLSVYLNDLKATQRSVETDAVPA